ncbi:MAG: glycosyl hydrolase [Cyclobacteriaceae bacterium]
MKYLFPVLIVLLISTSQLTAQKSKKIYPKVTSAAERWEGYLQRQKLQENSLVKNIPFRNVGPTIMSGRVVDLEVNPTDPTHFYVAYASGGLWETKNEGISFEPIFDNEIVMTIGDIAVDWNTGVIYVGSGENNSSRSSYAGYGVYKSTDNGKNWEHLGLEESHHIGRVVVHPTNSDIIWVASLGHLYSKSDANGIYRSADGGKSWEKTLFVNNQTGIVELSINPNNPDELIAAAWDKGRTAWNFEEAGDGSAIFRSTNGGVTWVNISSGDNGFPDTSGTGRIGLAYAAATPGMIYAILDNQDRRADEEKETFPVTRELLRSISNEAFDGLENDDINDFLDREYFPEEVNAVDLKMDVKSGKVKPQDLVIYLEDANSLLFDTPVKGAEVYVSTNSGDTWTKTHEGTIESLVFSYGYYFGQIRVDEQNSDILYTMGVPLVKSMDGGKTWEITEMENVHADHHALWLNPNRSGHLINGNDGGVNISYDYGKTWNKCNSTAVGQFYSVNVDMAEPYNVYGGLQDNGTWKGPSTYTYSRSWQGDGKYPYEALMGGDGMQVAIDTRTNETVYVGYQFGNYFRVNTASGKRKYITPKHQLGEAPFRWNWQSPIMLSSHNQDIVYFGSNKFHRSMNQGDDFETLSGDLTNGGKKGDVAFGTLTTITESPLRFGLIYVGSDDGLIHVSKDAGQNWNKVSGNLPQDYWVSRVTASAHQEGTVYASLNGYRSDDFSALVYKSTDYGSSWNQIGLDLPKEPVNVIKEDPENEKIIYVGTDHGVYVSVDGGSSFMAFSEGLPAVPIHDLVIHPRDKDLVIGTHGRSIYIADVSSIQSITEISDGLKVFPIEELTFSENWGNKGNWHWDGFREPSVIVEIYAKQKQTAQVEISKDSLKVAEFSIELDAGLNYWEYDLTISEDAFSNLISAEESDATKKAKENSLYYLTSGTYTLQVSGNDISASETFEIKEPKARPKRKGSE